MGRHYGESLLMESHYREVEIAVAAKVVGTE